MMAVVIYSKYKNYCEISINCITSNSSKLKCRNFANFSRTVFCLKSVCGDDAETEKSVREWGRGRDMDKVCGVGWGRGQCCGNEVELGTNSCLRAALYLVSMYLE